MSFTLVDRLMLDAICKELEIDKDMVICNHVEKIKSKTEFPSDPKHGAWCGSFFYDHLEGWVYSWNEI